MLKTLIAPNPSPMTLDGTRTFVVGRERPVVVDPGPAIPEHLDAIVGALEGRVPVAILLTHAHPDHADAAPPLSERTGAPVWMPRGAMRMPFDPSRVARWLEGGEEAETDAGSLRALPTPGHSPDHFAYLWRGPRAPEGGALFVGDLMMGEGDTTLVSPPEGDLARYLDSLDRVRALAPGLVLPAHGPPITEPAAALERYRAHRAQRIAQVVDALLRTGPARPAALLDAVYGAALHPALRGAAEGSLLAILGYLESTGSAQARPDGTFSLKR